jgi:hypothetical protein
MTRARGVSAFTALDLERHNRRHERFVRWLPRLGVGIGKNNPLVRDDFEKDASE